MGHRASVAVRLSAVVSYAAGSLPLDEAAAMAHVGRSKLARWREVLDLRGQDELRRELGRESMRSSG